ncbi:MAG: hypothetical protein ACYS47_00580 [Planctomycetota bacterium]|jgi:hypothetical protein
MKAMRIIAGGVALALLVAAGARGDEPELTEGVRIEADGKPIDVRVGHLVPVVVDWDGDGKKDLLVGQFIQGRIRFYRNVGEEGKPVFKTFEFLKAGGKEISVPSG